MNVRTLNLVRTVCALFLFFFASFAFADECIVKDVQKGDTLSHIADRNKVKGGWMGLWDLNKVTVKNPNLIYPGQKLIISCGATSVALRREVQVAPSILAYIKPDQMQAPLDVVTLVHSTVFVASPVSEAVGETEKESVPPAPAAIAPLKAIVADVGRADPLKETEDSSVGEHALPQGQGPPMEQLTSQDVQDAKAKTSSSTAKAVMNAVKTDVEKTDSVADKNAHPSFPATVSAVDDFNSPAWDSRAIDVNGHIVDTTKQDLVSQASVNVTVRSSPPRLEKRTDDDFDSPAWDSRAIDMNGRIVNTAKTNPAQSEVAAIPVTLLLAQ